MFKAEQEIVRLINRLEISRAMLLLAMLLACVPALASGTISNALSAREAGRGGVNLGFSDNGVILMDNPAGMQGLVGNCSCHRSFVDIGMVGLFTDLTYADADNPTTDAADNPTGLGHLMIGRRLNEDIVVGFGAFAPAGFASDYDLQTPPASLLGPRTYMSFGALIRMLPGISVQMTDAWTVGGTLGVAASHVEIEGPYFLNSGALAGTPTVLDLQATGAALSWSVGTQYKLSDQTIIGVRYQSANEFESDGKANVSITGLGNTNYDTNVALTWARSVGVGLMHHISSSRRVGLDFEWEDWSDAYDNATLTFTQPSNPAFAPFGSTIVEVFPLRWKDALIVSSGFEQDLSRGRTLRCGYRYQDSPVPAFSATTYLQTTLEHHFSAGFGFKHRGWELDTAYQFAFGPDVQTGTSIYPGGDFSNATLATQTHMVFLSAMRRY